MYCTFGTRVQDRQASLLPSEESLLLFWCCCPTVLGRRCCDVLGLAYREKKSDLKTGSDGLDRSLYLFLG